MIAHWNIQQGSLEWHKLRYGKIAGSSSKGLMVDSDTLLDELISARLEEFEPDDDPYESSAMERGNDLEPLARERLSEYTGYGFLECGWLQSESIPLIGISPDGITKDLKVACEIKCPGRKKHTNTLRNKILPLDHTHQTLHNFTVNRNLEKMFFMSFRPESLHQMFVYEVDQSTIINLGTKAKPVVKPVKDWVVLLRERAISMEIKVVDGIKALQF